MAKPEIQQFITKSPENPEIQEIKLINFPEDVQTATSEDALQREEYKLCASCLITMTCVGNIKAQLFEDYLGNIL